MVALVQQCLVSGECMIKGSAGKLGIIASAIPTRHEWSMREASIQSIEALSMQCDRSRLSEVDRQGVGEPPGVC